MIAVSLGGFFDWSKVWLPLSLVFRFDRGHTFLYSLPLKGKHCLEKIRQLGV